MLCSLPLERLDAFQIGGGLVPCLFEVVLSLQVHPERRRRAEITPETERGIRRNGGLLARQPLDTSAWDAASARDGIRRKLHRDEKLLSENLTRMNRRQFPRHDLNPTAVLSGNRRSRHRRDRPHSNGKRSSIDR